MSREHRRTLARALVALSLACARPTPATEVSPKASERAAERRLRKTGVPDVTRDSAATNEGRSGTARSGPSPFEIAVGMRGFSRELTYVQDVNANLRPYSLGLAPAAFVEGGWYPGAHFSRGVAAVIGVVGDFTRSIATTSAVSGRATYTTTLQAFSAGLRGRFSLGRSEIGLSACAGRQEFSVAGDTEEGAATAGGAPVTRGYVPDVAYTYVRPGLDFRIALGDLGVGLRGGYRFVIDAGEIQRAEWFPKATVSAGDLGLFVEYALPGGFFTRIGGDVHRYAYDMHSSPNDLRTRDVAGGAVDQYLAAYAAVAWRAE